MPSPSPRATRHPDHPGSLPRLGVEVLSVLVLPEGELEAEQALPHGDVDVKVARDTPIPYDPIVGVTSLPFSS